MLKLLLHEEKKILKLEISIKIETFKFEITYLNPIKS